MFFKLILFFLLYVIQCNCWQRWNYSTIWLESDDLVQVNGRQTNWYRTWGTSAEVDNAPRARMGHTMVKAVFKNSVGADDIYVVMFGGRGENNMTTHIPKTYNVKIVDGKIAFTTYTDKPISPCNDPEGIYWSKEERAQCNERIDQILVGVIYNDVWAYKITGTCKRYFDGPCENTGWVLWHPGALQGGCLIQLGIEVCTVPSERYLHGAAMFNDGCMYVYGGFSQRCRDYCDDIWFFDIYLKNWRQIYSSGALSHYYQIINSVNLMGDSIQKILPYDKVPISEGTVPWAGPGKRWRFSMECNGQFMAIFGGHRLWHGYAIENYEGNDWGFNNTMQPGGYMNDLWIYRKTLDVVTRNGEGFHSADGTWEQKLPVYVCKNSWDGISWAERESKACTTNWPSERAGHGSAIDINDGRQLIWLFGGYSTYYPYVRTDGSGSGPGVSATGVGGFVPYPDTYQFYKDDLWYYNMSNGIWTEVILPPEANKPKARADMVFEILTNEILLHGGVADNYYYDDMWYFNITTMVWLEKKTFVYPIYPDSCTDDLVRVTQNGSVYQGKENCVKLSWPKHLERSSFYPFEAVPYIDQQYYWPDSNNGPYWDIQPKDFEKSLTTFEEKLKFYAKGELGPKEGTPMSPFAATGPMQYVKHFVLSIDQTRNGTLDERCTSVEAEPTRGRILDGLNGRSNRTIRIPIPRTQAPGWDGCRNGNPTATDKIQGLRYKKPTGRHSHRAIFVKEKDEFYLYGGMSYDQERYPTSDDTWPSKVNGELWYINFGQCIKNCSNHGDCHFGFCFCDVGYWGEDCSNSSCPGTSCYYDETTHEQQCTHACQAGYNHTDDDKYVQDIAKIPCSRNPDGNGINGESNGICDGYGSSMCAPPFLGEDCSIKDCKNQCTYNGWCSIEYPVSRCLCNPGYFGEVCDQMQCLNNCSYPNGVCDTKTGMCTCRMMYSPYLNTREFKPWDGEDCSYIHAYAAAAARFDYSIFYLLGLGVLLLFVQLQLEAHRIWE